MEYTTHHLVCLVYILLTFHKVIGVAIPIYYKVREEEEVGTYIGGIIAQAELDRKYDHEEIAQMRFRYNVKPPKGKDYVSIEEQRGILRVKKKIDREKICESKNKCFLEYDVLISPAKFFDIIKVKIEVEDLNDHAPEFPTKQMILRIPESTIPGTSFSVPSANDPDGGINGVSTYQLQLDSHHMFEIKVKEITEGHIDVKLMVIDHLDRETKDSYHMKLVCSDGGNPPKIGVLNIIVNVQDSNDNDPTFEFETYEVTISENESTGRTIAKVYAEDKDVGLNGEIEYSFTTQTNQKYGHLFEIEPQSGNIFITSPLDFESSSMYILSVEARDKGHGSLMTQTNVVVHVEDVNDKAPEVSINTLSSTGIAEVRENSQIGTFVAHLLVTDDDTGDGGQFSCNISSPYFQLINISKAEFKILSKVVFDREERHRYEFPVVCIDNGTPTQTSVTNVVVRISDVNDHIPEFEPDTYTVSVHENQPAGSKITEVNATDLDIGKNGRISYKLASAATNYLRIDEKTGLITTARLLNYEELQYLDFLVYAEDKGENSKSASASVYLTIIDEDDEAPYFDRDAYIFRMNEEQAPNTEIGIIKASDPDSRPLNEFIYTFQNQRIPSTTFNIQQSTGVITAKSILDREKQSVYHLVAVARPVGNPSQSSSCSIIIHLEDINDHKPIFDFPKTKQNDTIHVSNKANVGYRITKLRAHDKDTGINAELMYKLVGGDPDKYFSMDSSTGNLYLYKHVTDLIGKTFALHLEVSDKGHPQLTDTSILYVSISNAVEFPYEQKVRGSNLLASSMLTIILSCTAGALLVLILIVFFVIICIREQHRRERQDIILNDMKETEKMIQQPDLMPISDVPLIHSQKTDVTDDVKNGQYPAKSNGVIVPKGVIDMRNSKVVSNPSMYHCSDYQQDPTADSHFQFQEDHNKKNGYIKEFSPNGQLSPTQGFYHKQFPYSTSPTNDTYKILLDYANSKSPKIQNNYATLPKEHIKNHSHRTVSGEYVHYDIVDNDIL